MDNGSEHKLVSLEIARFLCSISVLLWHYPVFTFVGGQIGNVPHEQLPFYTLLSPFYDRGFFAVQYFWCISGFIFFWKYQRDLRDGFSGRTFFVLRFSRLYPLHLATLLLVTLLQFPYRAMTGMYFTYTDNTPLNFGLHLLMLGNLQQPFHVSFNGVTWSVSVEVFAYISFFFVCRYIRPSGWFALLAAIACSVGFVMFFNDSKFLQCFALFYFGGCACIAHRWIVKHRLAAASAVALFAYYGALYWMRSSWPPNGYFRMVLCIPPTVLAFACLRLPRWMPARPIQFAGELTYSVYMLHFPIILASVTLAMAIGVHIDCRSPATFILFMCAVFGLSSICYVRFEKPAQTWMRRVLLKPKGAARPSAAAS